MYPMPTETLFQIEEAAADAMGVVDGALQLFDDATEHFAGEPRIYAIRALVKQIGAEVARILDAIDALPPGREATGAEPETENAPGQTA